jgi:hypothetical protein
MTQPDLLDIDGVAEFFGGNKPLHRATIWRKIKEGAIPAPIRELRRWDRGECEAARQAIFARAAETRSEAA